MSGGRQAEPRVLALAMRPMEEILALALLTVTLPAASADPIPPAGGPAARRELQCQNCHMPNRRYLWRGIHDAKMVRSGLDITLRADRARYRVGDRVHATLAIATPGVGYAFPTYVTPQLRVRAELVDEDGRFTLAYARHLEAPSPRLRVTVTVLPDEFYTLFFEALLPAGTGAGEAQIREALEATRRSPYTLYIKEPPLT